MTRPIGQLADQLEEVKEENRWLRDSIQTPAAQYIFLRHLDLSRSEKTILYSLETATLTLTAASLRRRLDVALERIDESGLTSVSVTICRLRKKLKTLNPPIEISNERGVGFYLDDENKKRLRDTRR